MPGRQLTPEEDAAFQPLDPQMSAMEREARQARETGQLQGRISNRPGDPVPRNWFQNTVSGLTKGAQRGFTAQGVNPDILPGEEIPANIGDILGTLGATLGPFVAGPEVGIPAAGVYASAREANRQVDAGRNLKTINWPGVAGQGALGAVTGVVPISRTLSPAAKIGTSAGVGALAGAAGPAITQATEGNFNPTSPEVLQGAAAGGVVGGGFGALSPALEGIIARYLAAKAPLPTPQAPPPVGAPYSYTDLPADIIGPMSNIRSPRAGVESAPLPPIDGVPLLTGGKDVSPTMLSAHANKTLENALPADNPLEKLLRDRLDLQQLLSNFQEGGIPETPNADAAKMAQQQAILDYVTKALGGAKEIQGNVQNQAAQKQQAILEYIQQALQRGPEPPK